VKTMSLPLTVGEHVTHINGTTRMITFMLIHLMLMF